MTPPALRSAGIIFDPERPDRTRKSLAPAVRKYCRHPEANRPLDEDPRIAAFDWDIDDAVRLRPLALQRLADIPDCVTLGRIGDHFHAIWRGGPAENLTRVILSRMLDAIPNARPACPDAYIDAAVAVLAEAEDAGPYVGFAPPVVAAAAREALRTLKFCPSIAELYDLCIAARAAFRQSARDVDDLIRLRADAESVLVELDEWPRDGMDDGFSVEGEGQEGS